MYGVACDGPFALKAFREKLGVSIPQLSDFEPKGAASKAFGAYFEPAGCLEPRDRRSSAPTAS